MDVLEHSPARTPQSLACATQPRYTQQSNIQPQIDYYLHGGIAATEQMTCHLILQQTRPPTGR